MKHSKVLHFPIILFLLHFYGCNNNNLQKENSQSLENVTNNSINLFSPCKTYNNSISNISDSVKFIKLESSTNCMLSDNTVDVEITDKFILIAEMFGIYQFDISGKFIRHIGRTGRGSNEYPQVNGMQIDQSLNLIYVFAGKKNGELLIYDFAGNFKNRICFHDNKYSDFNLVNSNLLALHPSCFERLEKGYKKLCFIDIQGNKVASSSSQLFPLEDSNKRVQCLGPSRNWSWTHNNKLFFLECGNDTIYHINTTSLIPQWILKGELKLSMSELMYSKNSSEIKGKINLIDKNIINDNSAVFESDNFLLFRCSNGEDTYFYTYDKKENKGCRTNYEKTNKMDYFIDNIISGIYFNPEFKSGNNMIAFLNIYDLKKQKTNISDFLQGHYSKQGTHLLDMVINASETDNPILMVVKFK